MDLFKNYLPRLTAFTKSIVHKIDYSFHPLHLFALIGILFTLHHLERTLDLLAFHIFTRRKPLEAYRRRGPNPTYALLTNPVSSATSLSLVKALSAHNFHVILVGKTTADIPGVTQIPLDPATATPEELETALRTTIVEAGLRVSILVNNDCYTASSTHQKLAACSPEEIDAPVARHVQFSSRVTALMLPVLLHRGSGVDAKGMSFGTHRRSLVLNLHGRTAAGVVDCGVAGFVKGFSEALGREMKEENGFVDVLAVEIDDYDCGELIMKKVDGAIGRGWGSMVPDWRGQLGWLSKGGKRKAKNE